MCCQVEFAVDVDHHPVLHCKRHFVALFAVPVEDHVRRSKPGEQRQAQFVAAHQRRAAAETAQDFEESEVAVGFDRVGDARRQAREGVGVGGDVRPKLRGAVEIKGAVLNRVLKVFDFDAFAVEITIVDMEIHDGAPSKSKPRIYANFL